MDVQDKGLSWWARGYATVLGRFLLAALALVWLVVAVVREYVALRGESSHERMRRAGGLT